MQKHTPEERAALERALAALAAEEPLSADDHAALSALEGGDLDAFARAWGALPAGARARLVLALRAAAAERLSLDYCAINRVALADAAPEVRLAAVESALEERDPALLERLLEMLRSDPHGRVRRAVAEDLARFALLCELGDLDAATTGRVRAALTRALEDRAEEPGVRNAALAALGYFSDGPMAETLAAHFRDPDLRLGAVRGMGRSADPRWTDRLLPVLGSEDPDLRLEAARALGGIEDERAIGPLSEVLDDSDTDVRLAAIAALGEIGGEEARDALLYVAEDLDPRVRDAVEKALADLTFYADPLAL